MSRIAGRLVPLASVSVVCPEAVVIHPAYCMGDTYDRARDIVTLPHDERFSETPIVTAVAGYESDGGSHAHIVDEVLHVSRRAVGDGDTDDTYSYGTVHLGATNSTLPTDGCSVTAGAANDVRVRDFVRATHARMR